jgi:hypothetical protein
MSEARVAWMAGRVLWGDGAAPAEPDEGGAAQPETGEHRDEIRRHVDRRPPRPVRRVLSAARGISGITTVPAVCDRADLV